MRLLDLEPSRRQLTGTRRPSVTPFASGSPTSSTEKCRKASTIQNARNTVRRSILPHLGEDTPFCSAERTEVVVRGGCQVIDVRDTFTTDDVGAFRRELLAAHPSPRSARKIVPQLHECSSRSTDPDFTDGAPTRVIRRDGRADAQNASRSVSRAWRPGTRRSASCGDSRPRERLLAVLLFFFGGVCLTVKAKVAGVGSRTPVRTAVTANVCAPGLTVSRTPGSHARSVPLSSLQWNVATPLEAVNENATFVEEPGGEQCREPPRRGPLAHALPAIGSWRLTLARQIS
jgi:hypothetical protein